MADKHSLVFCHWYIFTKFLIAFSGYFLLEFECLGTFSCGTEQYTHTVIHTTLECIELYCISQGRQKMCARNALVWHYTIHIIYYAEAAQYTQHKQRDMKSKKNMQITQ